MSDSELPSDARFAGVLNDPKFKKLPKWERKVKIDKRFQSMFKNDSFKVTYTVDKRGREAPRTTAEDLKKYYDLSSDEESRTTEDERESDKSTDSEVSDNDERTQLSDNTDSRLPRLNEDDDESRRKEITPTVRQKLKDMSIDYARGEGKLFSDSSSDETESEESDSEQVYHEWNELDKDAETTDDITNRIAVCNMDWDRIRAIDLMILFSSFLPPNSQIRSVIIYPSDFGLKRLAEEEIYGPAELRSGAVEDESDIDSDEETEESNQLQMESMRQYQLNRLKYYYAVATFDKPETADFIYKHCNGVEYESSGIRLDLRFIDDDITFDQEPKDSCDSTEDYDKYSPSVFMNTALQQVKVKSTWDETDPRRTIFAEKITEVAKMKDIDDSELKDFVALSSSEEENENEITFENNESEHSSEEFAKCERKNSSIRQYRKLLKEIEENEKHEKERDTELEITWGIDGVNSNEKNGYDEEHLMNDDTVMSKKKTKFNKKDNEMINDATDDESKDAKEKRKNRKKNKILEEDVKEQKELELLLNDENEENKRHFDLKKIQKAEKKSKKKKFKKKYKCDKSVADDFEVDVNDERFSAIYSSHLFSLDPTNPKFLKTKGMNAFLLEKQKRISEKKTTESDHLDEPLKKRRKDTDLSSLVKSVKNKTKSMLPNKFNKHR